MKIPPELFAQMRAEIEPLDTPANRARYLAGDFPRADRCKDRNMRYRWDLFYEMIDLRRAYKMEALPLKGYLDDHIDTALRRIVLPLKETT